MSTDEFGKVIFSKGLSFGILCAASESVNQFEETLPLKP